jgi:uncharacterized protein DUF5135
MTYVQDRPRLSSKLFTKRPEVAATPAAKPVLLFAVLGAAFALLQLYIHGSWIVSDDFHRIATGVTPVPDYMQIAIRGEEVFFTSALIATLYFLVWRTYRRQRRIPLSGLFVLALFFTWWQDPLFMYLTQGGNYSSANVNMGSWAAFIPGWNSPNPDSIPEPLLWDLSFYMVLLAGGAIGAAALMRRWRARTPSVSVARMFLTAFAVFAALDFVLEMSWVLLGFYHYGGVIDSLSLFPSRYYKFPLYEPIAVGGLMCGLTSVMYFVNDHGESLVERGASTLRIGTRGRTFVRYLALVGIANLVVLGYNLFLDVWQVNVGSWPKSVQERSYFVNGMCGHGTTYPCPSAQQAIAVRGASAHIGPDGTTVIPHGTAVEKLRIVPFSTEEK